MSDIEYYKNKLAKVEKNYDDFVYVISHDLSAPVRGISNLADFLAEELEDNESEEVQELLGLLSKNVTKTQKMLNVVLELSRINRRNLEKQEVDWNKSIDTAHEIYEWGSSLTINVSPKLPKLEINLHDCYRMLELVLENVAFHSNCDEKTIEVTSSTDEQYVSYYFHDNGDKIDEKHHDMIWQIFRTIESKKDHLGSGLYLLSKLMEKYDGFTELIETEQGNCFVLRFPKPYIVGS